MTRRLISWLVLLLLPFTVPWWFAGSSGLTLLGMPGWAFYGLVTTIAYACLVAWIMAKKWDVLARNGEEPDE